MRRHLPVARGSCLFHCLQEPHRNFSPIEGDARLDEALARYRGPKGNLRFPLDEPIPYDLIERLVRLRVKQDQAKSKAPKRKNIRQRSPDAHSSTSIRTACLTTNPPPARPSPMHAGIV